MPINHSPLIIAGPCSAETEEQVLQTCIRLAKTEKVNILRAGIWKPRTKPGSFEGIGSKALPWLQEAKKITELPIAIEVATAKHVEEAMRYNIDVLWIGARTTVNPFSVQAIADALRGVTVPVFIKNPTNPDVELWMGAVERMAQVGLLQIGLIHRGFSVYGNTEYRNAPVWSLAIEMKRRLPNMLMLCDPSHIAGRRDMLQAVAQRAIDLNMDGLMIETHIDPDNALSDAQQQITPEALLKLLNQLQWRTALSEGQNFVTALQKLREQIDYIDDELLMLLSQRMQVADKIGLYKKENNVAVLQMQRWNDILQRAYQKADVLSLSREFITQYFDAVHMESIQHQTKIMHEI